MYGQSKQMNVKTDGWIDRRMDRQTDGQTDGWIDRLVDSGQTDDQIYRRKIERWMNKQTDGQTEGWINIMMGRQRIQLGGYTDRWTEKANIIVYFLN